MCIKNTDEKEAPVLVFKTNITCTQAVQAVQRVLEQVPGIVRWNVALDDEDKILCIATWQIQPHEVVQAIACAGYYCEELPD